MSTSTRPEVVVVGAGPTGLLAACELARRGYIGLIAGLADVVASYFATLTS
jgi:NADPH-dependent 2,4-dienoyl-CoA reductase/sulfur reductase-like enzyme